MGREGKPGTSVSIRKEGPTLSYLVPLFVFYTGSGPSYTRCLHLLKIHFFTSGSTYPTSISYKILVTM